MFYLHYLAAFLLHHLQLLASAGIIGASCGFKFSITSRFGKMFLETIRNKKKHNKIVMPTRSKLKAKKAK